MLNVSASLQKAGYECGPEKGMDIEPYFKLYILMVCSNYHKLLSYESALHARGLDTINHPNGQNT